MKYICDSTPPIFGKKKSDVMQILSFFIIIYMVNLCLIFDISNSILF